MSPEKKKLYKIIKKEFGVRIRDFDEESTLLELSEKIVTRKENVSIKEAYEMYIGSKELHLPGWTAINLAMACGFDVTKVRSNITIGEMLNIL